MVKTPYKGNTQRLYGILVDPCSKGLLGFINDGSHVVALEAAFQALKFWERASEFTTLPGKAAWQRSGKERSRLAGVY